MFHLSVSMPGSDIETFFDHAVVTAAIAMTTKQ